MTKDNQKTQGNIRQLAKTKQTKKEETKEKRVKEADTDGVHKFTDFPPMEYNVKEIEDFLDMVFHDHDSELDGYVLTWNPKSNRPSYPISETSLLKKLSRTKEPRALYYGTSTCKLDPSDKKLYNRKSLFSQLHVVVLDDIGTKIPKENIPAALEPTYIIESSEGNYQYGYVLDKAINVFEHAEALIQLVYESGLSDAGGKMPNKLVRLPSGVNGKKSEKGAFKVRLVKTNGKFWTPQELLNTMKIGVSWDDVLKDADKVIKSRAQITAGTSLWSAITPQGATLDGIVDPVLEWFYENEKVVQEGSEWVTVECPWHQSHTTGDDFAGYSPVGRGDEGHKHMRGFHCFHEHCKDRNITDLLALVSHEAGIEVGVTDLAADLVAEWAYDAVNDFAWQIKGVSQPRPITMAAFRNTFPKKTRVTTFDGKVKPVADTALWLAAPNRVTVYGQVYDPTDPAKITQQNDGLKVNLFYHPSWGQGDYDMSDVNRFISFLEYLIPAEDEREYFLNWIAAKVQNMGFRGAAILMVTPQQGTGRTTLADMLGTLLGQKNTENVSFETITGGASFNDWLEKPLVITNETKDISTGSGGYFKAYEKLKDIVDPRPKEERINPKYGKQRMSMVYSSFLMFSNHSNAIAAGGNDRRIYVIRNTPVAEHPTYFTKLNAWLDVKDEDGAPKWGRSVWRWLSEREVDLTEMHKPAPTTVGKRAMIEGSKSPLTVAVEAIIGNWRGDFISHLKVREIIESMVNYFDPNDIPNFDKQVKAILSTCTQCVASMPSMRIEGRVERPKVKLGSLNDPEFRKYVEDGNFSKDDLAKVKTDILQQDFDDLKQAAKDAIDLQA